MAATDAYVESLIEEGLRLYSVGELDEALSRWRRALQVAPEHLRAKDYIKYVEDNRMALEESFRMASAHQFTPASSRSKKITSATLGVCPKAQPEGTAPQETGKPALAHRQSATGQKVKSVVPKMAEDEEETTARIDYDELMNRVEATRTPRPNLRSSTKNLPLIAEREKVLAKKTPSTFFEAVKEHPGKPLESLPFVVMDGEGEISEDSFEPLEKTPIGIHLPEPSRIVKKEQLPVEFEEKERTSASFSGTSYPRQRGDSYGREAGASERLESMLVGARQLYEQGTVEGSLWLCERVISIDPNNAEAKRLLSRNRQVLFEQYKKQLGSLEQIPVVLVPQHEIMWHKLDHRAGFLLSRIDGQLSFENILDVSGMDEFETYHILAQLLNLGVIGLH